MGIAKLLILAILLKLVQASGRWLLAGLLLGLACGAYEFIASGGESQPIRHAVLGLIYGLILFYAVDRVRGVLASWALMIAGFFGLLLLPW
jgi:hypothetical protein